MFNDWFNKTDRLTLTDTFVASSGCDSQTRNPDQGVEGVTRQSWFGQLRSEREGVAVFKRKVNYSASATTLAFCINCLLSFKVKKKSPDQWSEQQQDCGSEGCGGEEGAGAGAEEGGGGLW